MCPGLTKDIMDIFYSRLGQQLSRNYKKLEAIEAIEAIEVRVNQAYAGSSIFHFYISVNKLPEFHMEIYSFEESTCDKKTNPRFKWLTYLENVGLITNIKNQSEKLNRIYDILDEKRRTKKRTARLVHEIQLLNNLKNKYNVN
jgi:hypothetical protein